MIDFYTSAVVRVRAGAMRNDGVRPRGRCGARYHLAKTPPVCPMPARPYDGSAHTGYLSPHASKIETWALKRS
jgi:hypothetical protein